MFGCIDPGDTPAPSVESVSTALRKCSSICLPIGLAGPRLRPHTISRELATQKMEVLVEAAKELRARLSDGWTRPVNQTTWSA